jgi:plastocyanin
MKKTTRRNLLKAAAVGGISATGLAVFAGAEGAAAVEQQTDSGDEHAHDNRPLTDKRAIAVASFGQWDADPARPFDRQPITSDRTRNVHRMLPYEVEVDAGGAVSFTISGLHQILIYDNGRDLADVQSGAATSGTLIPGVPPLIEYATDRVYRGLDPRVLQYLPVAGVATPNIVQDRVESVNFAKAGRYLVVCGVAPHFNEGMHGYVNVKE